MLLRFTKMHGCGNDFVVLDLISQRVLLKERHIRKLADRHFGIGCDQVLIVEAPGRPDVDFRYRIYNADGGEVEQCGNGSRAFVKFVVEKGLTAARKIRVETLAGIIEPRLEDDGSITVDMGAPVLEPALVPFDAEGLQGQPEGRETLWPLVLELGGQRESVQVSVVSMGNPHAVQVVADVDSAPVELVGPLIEHHPRFPKRVNAGFMQLVDRQHVKLRVFERGAGETLACGTGACAAVVAGIRRGLLDSPVRVDARGGQLSIAWAGEGQPVYLTGPAVTVFEGEITL